MVDLHKYVPSKSIGQTCLVDNKEHTIEDKCCILYFLVETSYQLHDIEVASPLDDVQQIRLKSWRGRSSCFKSKCINHTSHLSLL